MAEAPARTGKLAGRVVTAGGKVVAGARVSLHETLSLDGPVQCVSTDAEGRFAMAELEPIRRGFLVADLEGEARGSLADVMVFAGGSVDVGDLALPRGTRVVGKVAAEDGRPITNAWASATILPGGHTDVGAARPYSDERLELACLPDGCLELPRLPPGRLLLTVGAPGRDSWSTELRIRPGRDTEDPGVVTLPLAPVVRGIVHGSASQEPIEGAVVAAADSKHQAATDAHGRFEITAAAGGGGRRLTVRAEGYCAGGVTVEDGAEGPAAEPRVQLDRAGVLQGTVVDGEGGAPVAYDQILVNWRPPGGFDDDEGDDEWAHFAILGALRPEEGAAPGEFLVEYEEAGSYRLVFVVGDRRAQVVTGVLEPPQSLEGLEARVGGAEDEPGEVADDWMRGLIHGVVRQGGQPVECGWVSLLYSTPGYLASNFGILPARRGRAIPEPWYEDDRTATQIGPDGRFEVRSPWKQAYLRVSTPGNELVVGPIRVGSRTRRDIELPPPGGIAGTVAGVPPEIRGELWVLAFQPSGAVVREARVDREGRFELAGLPAGAYGLKIGHDGMHDPLSPSG